MTKLQTLSTIAYLDEGKISSFIKQALLEDIGPGDYSTLASINGEAVGRAELVLKEAGVVAGIKVGQQVFHELDPELKVEILINDSTFAEPGDRVMTIAGKAQSILTAERLALNIMQRMSGIATKTAYLTNLISHTKCKLLDTRKTTPNFRMFEKWAVLLGGGKNHRYALYDMVMLKDNHIDYSGGIIAAVARTRDFLQRQKLDLKIEVETRNLKEVEQAIMAGADIILLDNMPVNKLKEAVELIDGRVETEASGGITDETIVAIAETGVDYISVGALTHSYKSLDMSLKAIITE